MNEGPNYYEFSMGLSSILWSYLEQWIEVNIHAFHLPNKTGFNKTMVHTWKYIQYDLDLFKMTLDQENDPPSGCGIKCI